MILPNFHGKQYTWCELESFVPRASRRLSIVISDQTTQINLKFQIQPLLETPLRITTVILFCGLIPKPVEIKSSKIWKHPCIH